jgi:tyrosyl-tRNA synthetase
MGPLRSEFEARGLVEIVSSDALWQALETESVPFYAGYDPTSRSLQIGNLFAIITMRRLQLAGHRPVVLVGGATGMIGDPSGKSAERNLLDEEQIRENVAGIRAQLERFIDFDDRATGATLVNNHDWLGAFGLIGFLRDVGKRFRLGEMLAKESVKRRLASEEGISFTEFTYQMLQAYDFLHLHREHGVRLQIGGSDQWGNITAGIDLVRKVAGAEVHGLVIPLVTDSQGKKFGKSEGGTIYLDADMTSPYRMYQYLLNAEDASVVQYLKYFTLLPLGEIDALARETGTNPGAREAQRVLAAEVTRMVHGAEGLAAAERATRIFFGEPIEQLAESELDAAFADAPAVTVPRAELEAGLPAVDLLARTPLFKSKGEARRAIQQKGAYLNNVPLDDIDRAVTPGDLVTSAALVIRRGKKSYCLVRVD